MNGLKKAKEPFRFYTRMILPELTGLRAADLGELLKHVREAAPSSIFHHTHRFLQQHQYLSPEPPNDFAYWVTEILGEWELGEKLASIDTIEFSNIDDIRSEIAGTIEKYLEANPSAASRGRQKGREFHFVKSISFIFPTNYAANDLAEFVDVMKRITIDSIYFHIFEARLRFEKEKNDFSFWIETSIGDKKMAEAIAKLDPYTHTMEDLRKAIITIAGKKTK